MGNSKDATPGFITIVVSTLGGSSCGLCVPRSASTRELKMFVASAATAAPSPQCIRLSDPTTRVELQNDLAQPLENIASICLIASVATEIPERIALSTACRYPSPLNLAELRRWDTPKLPDSSSDGEKGDDIQCPRCLNQKIFKESYVAEGLRHNRNEYGVR